MRADRLITLLMLLQSRGRMTAEDLAAELEVSVRTIYRDLEALSASGVPVYTESGHGGGCALIENYRTNLTGFTADELRALFMLSIPEPLEQLGVSRELNNALLKLSAALPETRRRLEIQTRQRIHLDSALWFQGKKSLPHLSALQKAVWEEKEIHIQFRSFRDIPVELDVQPLGLVAKSTTWYLVADYQHRPRVIEVAQIDKVISNDRPFTRPENFDLIEFWKTWCQFYEKNQPRYPVYLRMTPWLASELKYILLDIHEIDPVVPPAPDPAGWVHLVLVFRNFREARGYLLNFGRDAEILSPDPLRMSVIDFAEQICAFYTKHPPQ